MANLARSALTFNAEWSEGRNRRIFVRDVTAVLTGQGTVANAIPASIFGFTKILRCDVAVKSDNTAMYVGAPSFNGDRLLLSPGAAPMVPADVTATVRMVVGGLTM
jgi:hypothetical protein